MFRNRKSPLRAFCALLAALTAAIGLCGYAQATADTRLDQAAAETAQYLCTVVGTPQVGETGGEWTVLGLARAGAETPESYFADYYQTLARYVSEREGVLHSRKYTEYARVILAVSAIGHDARDVAGYDLTAPLGDYERTVWQGLNGPIWALLALDSRNYPMPAAPDGQTQATRQMYLAYILERQLPDGGWSLAGEQADPDMTAMALQALAGYTQQPEVSAAVERALACLSACQDVSGGFVSNGVVNAESCAQVLGALCRLGVAPDDPRFVKNGRTVLDALLSFSVSGGGFAHVAGGPVSLMATEQGMCALAAALRAQNGQSGLYCMTDVSGTRQPDATACTAAALLAALLGQARLLA